jgi:hypothetical protein
LVEPDGKCNDEIRTDLPQLADPVTKTNASLPFGSWFANRFSSEAKRDPPFLSLEAFILKYLL